MIKIDRNECYIIISERCELDTSKKSIRKYT